MVEDFLQYYGWGRNTALLGAVPCGASRYCVPAPGKDRTLGRRKAERVTGNSIFPTVKDAFTPRPMDL